MSGGMLEGMGLQVRQCQAAFFRAFIFRKARMLQGIASAWLPELELAGHRGQAINKMEVEEEIQPNSLPPRYALHRL
jgi:hypothetical protein